VVEETPLVDQMLQHFIDAWPPRGRTRAATPERPAGRDARRGGASRNVRRAAARALVDFGACVSAGIRHLPQAWPHPGAGRMAAAANALDRDDVHWDTLTHPGSIVWPVIIDLGGDLDVTGETAVRAAAFGYESMIRMAAALGPVHRRTWHATATAGTIGAAVAAGVLLGLDSQRLADAAGHAISVAGGSSRCLVERSGTRLFHRAHAAQTGLECARAAAAGLGATRFGLEGESGMLAAMSSGADSKSLLVPIDHWAIESVGLRFYAATGFAHSAIDAALRLAPIDAIDVAAVRVETGPAALALAGNLHPRSDEAAWWSIPHAVAVCLATARPAELTLGRSPLPAVEHLLDRMRVEQGDRRLGSLVEITFRDGRTAEADEAYPLGHPARPLSDAQLLDKWSRLTGRDGARVWKAAEDLEDTNLRDLAAVLLPADGHPPHPGT